MYARSIDNGDGGGDGAMEPSLAPVYHFTPKHRWQVKLHLMSGITLWPWLKFLRRHYMHIDWGTYWHRVLFLSTMSVINSFLAFPDWLLYSGRIRRQALHPEPLFILGHPRTGTTHLHNLLSLDPAFAFCNTFHAGFPSSFIAMAPLRGLLSPLLEERRPMDNMALNWDLPAEDEIATLSLTGGTSPYACIVLPREARRSFCPFYTFEYQRSRADSYGRPACAAELQRRFEEWTETFTSFLKKVTLWHALQDGRATATTATLDTPATPDATPLAAPAALACSTCRPPAATDSAAGASMPPTCSGRASTSEPKPLLIKSPVHTARVELLLKLFPSARFLYIHRHPLQVFQSAAHMADTYYWYTYLHTPTNRHITDFVLNQYELLYEQYIRGRTLVQPGRLHELSFDELEADPIAALRAIYVKFGWLERFEALVPRFRQYCNTLSDFKKNCFSRLSPEMADEVRRRWAPSFQEFGYK